MGNQVCRGDPKLVCMVEDGLYERGQWGPPVEALKGGYTCNPMSACDTGWGSCSDLFHLNRFLSSHLGSARLAALSLLLCNHL